MSPAGPLLRIGHPDVDADALLARILELIPTRNELPPLPGKTASSALIEQQRNIYRANERLNELIGRYGSYHVFRGGAPGRLEEMIKRSIRRTIQRHIDQQKDVHEALSGLIEVLLQYLDAQHEQIQSLRWQLEQGPSANATSSLPARWVDGLEPSKALLVIDCGRGELVAQLRRAGLPATGIEQDATALAWAKRRGQPVEQAEPRDWLAGLDAGSLGGLVLDGSCDRLAPEQASELLEQATRALAQEGRLVLGTLYPDLLGPLLKETGFEVVEQQADWLLARRAR